jgi:NSS family neurotransmitter:Na+ symporter
MSVSPSSDDRGEWGSSFGFIMAAAGSAVGLGNIWRFPYITGQYGGGAFVFVYILCVILIGAPLLFNEIALGRLTGKNPIGAFKDTGSNKFWILTGALLAILVSFFVLTYYGVIAGWTIGYIFKTATGNSTPFTEFAASGSMNIGLFASFMVLVVIIVMGGVSGGIEKAAKILMPMLFLLVFVVIIRSVTLEGAGAGIDFYLNPDFSKITGGTVLAALGQAFFSMSIGWGIMITYGSYLPKSNNIVSSGLWVGFMDAGVAILGGLMVFPAVFAFGQNPGQGPALVFEVLPNVFAQMPGGAIVGSIFFLLLMVAALTSAISMLEVPASYFIDEKHWSRKKAAIVVAIITFIVGVPSALSYGGSDFFTNMSLPTLDGTRTGNGFFGILDYYFGTVFIVIVALATAVYVGWVMKLDRVVNEIKVGSEIFSKKIAGLEFSVLWSFFIKYICPIVIALVFLNMIGVFGEPSGGG